MSILSISLHDFRPIFSNAHSSGGRSVVPSRLQPDRLSTRPTFRCGLGFLVVVFLSLNKYIMDLPAPSSDYEKMTSKLVDLKSIKATVKLYDGSEDDSAFCLYNKLGHKPETSHYDKEQKKTVSGLAPLASNILVALVLTEICCAKGRGKVSGS